jgi:hypothetical protein
MRAFAHTSTETTNRVARAWSVGDSGGNSKQQRLAFNWLRSGSSRYQYLQQNLYRRQLRKLIEDLDIVPRCEPPLLQILLPNHAHNNSGLPTQRHGIAGCLYDPRPRRDSPVADSP